MLSLGAVIALIIAVGAWKTRYSNSPVVYEDARIVRFGVHHRDEGSHLLVLVRVKSGRVIQLDTSFPAMRHCRAGGRIRLHRQGPDLYVPRGACTLPVA